MDPVDQLFSRFQTPRELETQLNHIRNRMDAILRQEMGGQSARNRDLDNLRDEESELERALEESRMAVDRGMTERMERWGMATVVYSICYCSIWDLLHHSGAYWILLRCLLPLLNKR